MNLALMILGAVLCGGQAALAASFTYTCEPDSNPWAVTQTLQLNGSTAFVSFKPDPWHPGERFRARRDYQYNYVPDHRDRRDKAVFTKISREGGRAIIVDQDMIDGVERGDLKIRYFGTEPTAKQDGIKNVTYGCRLKSLLR